MMRPHERIEMTKEDEAFVMGPLMQEKINLLLLGGVKFYLPHTTMIGPDVEIGKRTRVWHCVTLLGKTHIGEGCDIETGVVLEDVTVDDGSTIHADANIRKECRIGKNVEIWTGVRMYNSWIKDGVIVRSPNRIVRSIIGENCEIDSYCLIKDAEVDEECTVGSYTTILGKSRPHRTLTRGGRTVRIRPGTQVPPHESIISKKTFIEY